LARSFHEFDLTRPPRLVEKRFESTTEADDNVPAFARDGLEWSFRHLPSSAQSPKYMRRAAPVTGKTDRPMTIVFQELRQIGSNPVGARKAPVIGNFACSSDSAAYVQWKYQSLGCRGRAFELQDQPEWARALGPDYFPIADQPSITRQACLLRAQ
jgi:hypothetical protein